MEVANCIGEFCASSHLTQIHKAPLVDGGEGFQLLAAVTGGTLHVTDGYSPVSSCEVLLRLLGGTDETAVLKCRWRLGCVCLCNARDPLNNLRCRRIN